MPTTSDLTRSLVRLLLHTSLADTELRDLRFEWGEHRLDVARAALRGVSAQAGPPGLRVEVREVELSGLTLAGPLALPETVADAVTQAVQAGAPPAIVDHVTAAGAASTPWRLEPLAGAEGTLRARIEDAHLSFDADVTVPLSAGAVDFNRATVEHFGPDSRMGVSRLGIYVEGVNGRTYLYQFDAAPLSGVTLEQRGSLFAPGSGHRGGITLQPFVESLLRQAGLRLTRGVTEQARLLFGRTSVQGQVRLGDGLVQMRGLRTRLQAQAPGHNTVELRAEALGRGLVAAWPSLSAVDTEAEWHGLRLACAQASGRVTLQLELAAGAVPRFVLTLDPLRLSGLALRPAD